MNKQANIIGTTECHTKCIAARSDRRQVTAVVN